jgi:hypothetical protein
MLGGYILYLDILIMYGWDILFTLTYFPQTNIPE